MILSSDQVQIRETARAFARTALLPHAAEWDRTGQFPAEAMREAAALGFMGMLLPDAFGGCDAGQVALAIAMEEIAAGDGACSTIIGVHNSVACRPILIFGDAEQKAAFLPKLASGEWLGGFALTEAQAGSDAANLRTRARRDGDAYVMTGGKHFITSGQSADVLIVFAVTDASVGKQGISAFIVPTCTPGYRVVRVESKMGQRASDTCQIAFDDMRLPASLRLGDEGAGYRIALSNLEGGRIGIAAQAVGMARAAFEAARDYARTRETFGRPIIAHQAVSFRLAEMATQIAAARQLTWHAATLRDAGEPCLAEACMAKLFASEMAERVCSDALQIHGGYGYLTDYPVERILRNARVCQIYEGSNDIQKIVIAGRL